MKRILLFLILFSFLFSDDVCTGVWIADGQKYPDDTNGHGAYYFAYG